MCEAPLRALTLARALFLSSFEPAARTLETVAAAVLKIASQFELRICRDNDSVRAVFKNGELFNSVLTNFVIC